MERIVLGISAINFSNSSDILSEKPIVPNSALNTAIIENCWLPSASSFSFAMASDSGSSSIAAGLDVSSNELGISAIIAAGDSSDSESTPPHRKRCLPPRNAKSKENSLLRIKRRSIMKPRRNHSSDIKKIYLDNKLKGNFRPSNLETIFEEPTPDKKNQLCFIGAKKIKRSLSCSDGLNVTKTTVKSRRNKIKKTFGRRFALKKISMDDFIDRLNASFDERQTTSTSVPQTPTHNVDEKDDDEISVAGTTGPGDMIEADEMECCEEALL